ncbi:hypothetical protein N7495_001768, partial [Penicillium taxi]|uniref:uncharacterized protein n=1 Tax=Penicillium taxi TaxID=168475 RepID=UPI002544FB3F
HDGDAAAPPAQVDSALYNRRRRRQSLPQRAHGPASSIDPTSPEVISSLISSLSAISVPLNSHFDSVPRIDSKDSSPGLPEVPHTAPCFTIPPSEQNGLGMSYGNQALAEEPPHGPFLHPDDAAVGPVIRMARAAPLPKSPRSPKFKPVKPSESSRPASKDSYTSLKASDSTVFGTISTEPGPLVSRAASIKSNGSRMSLRDSIGLFRKSSRELTNDKEPHGDRPHKASSLNENAGQNFPRNRASLRSMYSMGDVAEETSLKQISDHRVASTPSSGEFSSPQDTPDQNPGGIGSGRAIPKRNFSMKQGDGGSPSRNRLSMHHRRYSSATIKNSSAGNGSPGTGNDADPVTRRIQEVKDQQQRIQTELKVDNSPAKYSRTHTKQVQTPRSSSHSQISAQSLKTFGSLINESAPSPSVMTGKNRQGKPGGAPLVSKMTQFPLPPTEKPLYEPSMRSMEQATTPKNHRRTPSGPILTDRVSFNNERPSSADSIDLAVYDYVTSPKLTQKVIHPASGRTIAFSEVGDPKGHVVLCCLGMGLTRYLPAFYDELARTLNLRLVTLDRPGVGESEAHRHDESSSPLSWPDDVAIVCNHLRVTKFSILAHSAGAIYALATALRIPQHIRGRIHLLAPWIPPSQLSRIGFQKDPAPANAVPYSVRILRALPTSLLKVANTSFMSATSASITTSLPKSPRRVKKKPGKETTDKELVSSPGSLDVQTNPTNEDIAPLTGLQPSAIPNAAGYKKSDATIGTPVKSPEEERERQQDYDIRLTHKIWGLATTNANPAVDLLICLERRQTIGFQYVDITRSVVIQHGSKDTRVPMESVQWLGKTMRRCEVRVLEGEGHGLMASAAVMGSVLTEIAKEWEDWTTVVQGKRRATVTARPNARPGLAQR